MKFVERVMGMFTKPGETIKDILKEPRTEEPLVIVGVFALLVMISGYISAGSLGGGSMTILSLLVSVVFVLIGWPIATGVVHVMALFLGGQGKYNPEMLNAIGYTYIVKYIPMLISMAILFFVPAMNTAAFQVTPTMSQDQIMDAMRQMVTEMERYYTNPLFILSQVIMYLGLLWSCYLGSIAVQHGDNVSRTSSLIAVFVPAIFYIVLSVGMTFGSLILMRTLYGL